MRDNFFLSGKKSNWKTLKKNKSCESVCAGYNDFASRRFGYERGSKETHIAAMSLAAHSDGVGVKSETVAKFEVVLPPGPMKPWSRWYVGSRSESGTIGGSNA